MFFGKLELIFFPKQANLQWTPNNPGEGEQIQGKDKKFI